MPARDMGSQFYRGRNQSYEPYSNGNNDGRPMIQGYPMYIRYLTLGMY